MHKSQDINIRNTKDQDITAPKITNPTIIASHKSELYNIPDRTLERKVVSTFKEIRVKLIIENT